MPSPWKWDPGLFLRTPSLSVCLKEPVRPKFSCPCSSGHIPALDSPETHHHAARPPLFPWSCSLIPENASLFPGSVSWPWARVMQVVWEQFPGLLFKRAASPRAGWLGFVRSHCRRTTACEAQVTLRISVGISGESLISRPVFWAYTWGQFKKRWYIF